MIIINNDLIKINLNYNIMINIVGFCTKMYTIRSCLNTEYIDLHTFSRYFECNAKF